MKLIIFLLATATAYAALPAGAKWEIRTTGSNLNGGGFNAARGGTPYNEQDTAQEGRSDGASADTSTTFTSTAATFTDAMKGNYIRISSGTQCTVGWYEVVSVTDADHVVLDRTPAVSGQNCSSAVYKLGGAFNLGTANTFTLDDDVFEAAVAGNIFYIKAGTYTTNETIGLTTVGTSTAKIAIVGYNATRDDNPTGSTRPLINVGTGALNLGAYWDLKHISVTGSGSTVFAVGGESLILHSKFVNTSTTEGRTAVAVSTADAMVVNCEAISYRGIAVLMSARSSLVGIYAHDSQTGISIGSTSTAGSITDSIISDNTAYAINSTAASTNLLVVKNVTLYGSQNTTGVGVNLVTGLLNFRLMNSIIYGFANGVVHADATHDGWDNWNAYYNNDDDETYWTKGANDVATDPGLSSGVGQLTGATATTSGSVLTQSGGDFSTVTDNVDFVYLTTCTAGCTVGKYKITGHTSDTITLDIAPGDRATADVVWQITTGHNFAVGTNMKALASPGAFPGDLTTGYLDIGAVQRVEPTSGTGSGGSYPFVQ
jgi:hypothetical protein